MISFAGAGLVVNGPTVVQGKGRLRTSASGRVEFGDDDWPVYAPGHVRRKRTILTPCALGDSLPEGSSSVRMDTAARQFVACSFARDDGSVEVGQLFVPLRVHDGGTIDRATIGFRVGRRHTLLPTMPRARIVRVDRAGEKVPLTSQAAGADPDGWVTYGPAPSAAAAWFDGGRSKRLEIPCDQHNVVDKSQYTYWAEVVEESGLEDPPFTIQVKDDVEVARTSGSTSGEQVIDGVTALNGTRVLQMSAGHLTGIWLVRAGEWERAPDARTPEQLQGGLLVRALSGSVFNNMVFRHATPTPSKVAQGLLDSGDELRFDPSWWTTTDAFAGNIWQAVSVRHVDIEDGRFQ